MANELFTAIKGGDKLAVERLLDKDHSLVDAREESGLSPLLAALYRGKDDIAMSIVRRGPKLSVFEAAASGDLVRVRELVERDRSLANAVAPDGYSPLGLAAFFGRSDVAVYLIERSADPRAASRQGGFTPLHSAVATDAAPTDVQLVRTLLDAGADPNARSLSGGTPLHTAAFTGDRVIVDLLLERGGDASIKNEQGKTPAEIARERGHPEIAELLEDRLTQR